MTEAQRQQADDGLRQIKEWLSDYFDFNAKLMHGTNGKP